MNTRIDKICCFTALTVSSFMLIGCDPDPTVERLPVTGEVTLDDRPLSSATIRFISDQRSGDAATVITAGKFQFDQENGLAPGAYDVVVTPNSPELNEAIEAIQSGDRDPLQTRTVPARYQRSGALQATIDPDADNHYRFELSSR
ncbi:carboxypeptidase-like regulatory domain-containing protein [Aporhodopirellula aestuarii]|uniref:Carboxypeptidase-like regulatory domain-containing protein n=1 Tax=Aporhodopirellula aestuarii TaxID=2950107 RepID=A0ABT0TWI8_9BACT|nr:carboxypeptidase-like regulatory domain-containing protein [Aporhodopirellula aestuarii]MCM2369007.1 carboxypeptidase-like regulatory domain-containing protein [Aporhodopirellula aestuarii]